jgi:hypothetical protein
MGNQKLMRVVYPTDRDPAEPEYIGSFSGEFPAEGSGRRIVAVDWSTPGEAVQDLSEPLHHARMLSEGGLLDSEGIDEEL